VRDSKRLVTICGDWTIWASNPSRERGFLIFENYSPELGPIPAFYSMVTGVPSLVVKWLLLEVIHPPLFCAKVKNNWSNISTLPNNFTACTVTNYLKLLLVLVSSSSLKIN